MISIDDEEGKALTLSFKQQDIIPLGVQVLEGLTAFNFWLDTPERRNLFTSTDGLDTLKEELTELSKEIW